MNNIPNQHQQSSPRFFMGNFWTQYSKQFFDFNLRQLAELSGQLQLPMPLPTKIEELGQKHLQAFLLEIFGEMPLWTATQTSFNNNSEATNRYSNTLATNGPSGDFSHVQPPQNLNYGSNSKNNGKYETIGMQRKTPDRSSDKFHQTSVRNNPPAYGRSVSNPSSELSNLPTPYNNSIYQSSSMKANNNEMQGNIRGRGRFYQSRPPNRGNFKGYNSRDPRVERYHDESRKSPYLERRPTEPKRKRSTGWSDDETSEKAASGVINVEEDEDDYSKRLKEDLGF